MALVVSRISTTKQPNMIARYVIKLIMGQKIWVLDFGSQTTHLIARRISSLGIPCKIVTPDISVSDLEKAGDLAGLILSGGANSVYDGSALKLSNNVLLSGLPVLGICYGHQLIIQAFGGKVEIAANGEYGRDFLMIKNDSSLLDKSLDKTIVWMNHRDIVTSLPTDFIPLAYSKQGTLAAYAHRNKLIYGVQFHPEVTHTQAGDKILSNFVTKICGCQLKKAKENLIDDLTNKARTTIAGRRAIIGLSGGVDSAVAAAIVGKAIGQNLIAVYVDTGLMREGETKFIKHSFGDSLANLKIVRAGRMYFAALKGVNDPEKKRKIIGKLFADIFWDIAKQEKADVLIQGTIYSDRIESGGTEHASTIKSHHNVGGMPKSMKLKIYEPLREFYKDEVRKLAQQLGLADSISNRKAFPGPGLAIRVVGEVTPHRIKIVRRATKILEEELINHDLYKKIWMGFTILLPIKSVGIQGDGRSYKYPIVIRIIESRDAMTAQFSRIDYNLLEKVSTRITNEVAEVNRIVYDITHKPPATMEWE